MKRTKIKKDPKVTLSAKDLTKIKRDVTKEATDKACLMERTDRYAAYIDKHLVQMEDIRKTIEKQTGIKIMG